MTDDLDPFDLDLDQDDAGARDGAGDRAVSPVAGPQDPLFGGLDVTAWAGQLVGPAVQRAIEHRSPLRRSERC